MKLSWEFWKQNDAIVVGNSKGGTFTIRRTGKKKCKLESFGLFLNRILFHPLTFDPLVSFPSKVVWWPLAPHRVACLCWTATSSKILTVDDLKHSKFSLPNIYFLCWAMEESVHIYLFIILSTNYLVFLLTMFRISSPFTCFLMTLKICSGALFIISSHILWKVLPLAIAWEFCKERNQRIFLRKMHFNKDTGKIKDWTFQCGLQAN